ncbi:hypothetical protein CPB86DRAFT_789508 [Serendipita vermifera]|nr:hypothetical protein CPB86DRAFT_789508 [Serendipita vermifera]
MATNKQYKTPDLQLGTEKSTALQAAIQDELVARGFTTGEDNVMAEYVLIMLINKKLPEQVDKELSDFIGPEQWDSSFVDWLFEEAVKENPGAPSKVEEQRSIVTEAPPAPQPIPTVMEQRDRDTPRRSGAPPRLYNQAVNSAQKRSASNRSPSPGGSSNKAPRRSDAPSGPRAMREQNEGNRRSLKDRLGGFSRDQPPMPMNQMGGPPRFPPVGGMPPPMPQFNQDMQGMQGMNPNAAMTEMLVQQNALLQGLLHTMANGMQLPMQGMPGMTGMPGMPGMGPNNGPFFNNHGNQGFQPNGRGRGGGPPNAGRRQQPDGSQTEPPLSPGKSTPAPSTSGIQAPQPVPANAPAPSNIPDLFDRPLSPTLCKFGVNCTNALCRYSHPSAAASVESGVVLSTEACPNGRHCQNKDCTLSHPSAGTNMTAPTSQHKPAAPAFTPSPGPNTFVNTIPCKFGVNCTRPGCPYLHPTTPASKASIPCKFGIHCTRVDCQFSHPPGRVNPASFKGLGGTSEKPHANRSMRFNTSAPEFVPKAAGGTGNTESATPGADKPGDSTTTPSAAGAKDPNPAEVIAAV